uniref:guanylate cyclase n=1 Tax=Hofstenia miamia TaxID=442651 RepID=A0A5P8I4L1_HOFMI|nr:gucy1a protein [Hofstenia miamia]
MAFPKLPLALKNFVTATEGDPKWEECIKNANYSGNIEEVPIVGDEWPLRLCESVGAALDKPMDVFMDELGEIYLDYILHDSKIGQRVQYLAPDILGFVTNLDNMFHYLKMNVFNKENDSPSFRLEDEIDDKKEYTGNKEVHYYSRRNGYWTFAFGFLKSVMKKLYQDTKTVIQFKSQNVDIIKEDTYEHAVFLLLGKGRRQKKVKPPKMVAETEKGSEGQLDKQTVNAIMNAIKTGNVTKTRKRWAMIKTAMAFGALIDKFEPIYPKRVAITPELFCEVFPYHMAFDKNLKVKHVGVSLQRMFAPLRMGDCTIENIFKLVHPPVDFNPTNVRLFPNQLFQFEAKPEALPTHYRKDPMLRLRGQFIWIEQNKCFLFLSSPAVERLHEISQRHFCFGEMALHDKTRDLGYDIDTMAVAGNFDESGMIADLKGKVDKLNKDLKAAKNKPPEIKYVDKIVEVPVPTVVNGPVVADGDDSDLKRKLQKALQDLDDQKDRCLEISSSMLPWYLAQQWCNNNYKLNFIAGVYEDVTVLFADVVQFSLVCNQCKPEVVTDLLNNLYRTLDRLTFVHDVFKVEYIGDAYVCCGGLPIPVESHAERICNMALAIMAESKKILSPLTQEHVKLRIGIHTGPVITGVVGEKVPRFCVYGSTLTFASRMESHSLAGRIQVSPATKTKVENKGFTFMDRGEIEVRGIGAMHAYLLEGNSRLNEKDLCGYVENSEAKTDVYMNAGGSNYFYSNDSIKMMHYVDNLKKDAPFPKNPLAYEGVGKTYRGTTVSRQKTLANINVK